MNESKPISWAYPFPGKDTSNNPLQLLTHMAQAKGGFYPTGENGLWHGGVHFDEGTAAAFDQSSVRCIADGEVIAYRIDERYPVSEFTEDIPLVKRAPFSTGFVLVKHSLQPPPLKNADGSIVEGQTPPSLTLYSLYMHLLDWAGYQAQPDLPRAAFWETRRYKVNTQQDGLSVRAGPSKNTTKLSELSKGAEITIGETEGEFSKLVSLISGTAEPALSADDEGQLPGYVSTSLLKPHSEPAEYDKVVVLDSGVPIKAGELIGHPGLYQNHDSAAQHMVHVELFSCDDVPAFIARSRAWASRLPDDQKTLLKVYQGASKLIPHRNDINAENPPKLDDDGTQIGVDLIIPQSLLDGLPTSRKIQTKDGADNTMYWWRLDGLFADADGNPIDGWLAEQELITTRHSPWEWEGFECLEDADPPISGFVYYLNAALRLSDDEKASYQGAIDQADKGPVRSRLYDIIDTNRDGKMTSQEIQVALEKPCHAQSISQLVTRHESEWFWNAARWDELDELMGHRSDDPNQDWAEEKNRIKTLSWWGDIPGRYSISADGKAWHFQPLALIGIFSTVARANHTISEGRITFDAEGNNIPTSPFFSRVIHWPGNNLSGVTLGRGYDMGSRTEIEIYDHMTSAGIAHDQATKIAQAHGKKGLIAQQFVRENKSSIGQITPEQEILLFNIIYPNYVDRAISNYDHWTASEPDRTDWNALDQVIRDVLVDFVYQGFTKGPNPMKAGMRNDKAELIRYIENTPAIRQYEPGRNRARYLRNN